MPDANFEDPRLVAVYDALDPDRDDLDAYLAIVDELGAHRVVDLGCGTGVLALLLAERGVDVVGVDPAAGSLAVARSKSSAGDVRWLHGDASVMPALEADLVVMTGNAAQAVVEPEDWAITLDGARRALRTGGHLVLETRDPVRRAWEGWTPEMRRSTADVPGAGRVESCTEVDSVDGQLVSFRETFVFDVDGAVLVSTSTLRFREREEVGADLVAHGFVVEDVRDAPDRPGAEMVFVARRDG